MEKTLNSRLVISVQSGLGKELEKLNWISFQGKGLGPLVSCLFNKAIGEQLIYVIDVQRDKYWTNDNGMFTLNLGIYHRAYHSEFGFKLDGYIDTGCCILKNRIGMLKAGKDEWYVVNRKTSIEFLSRQIWNDFGQYGLTWFGSISDEKTLINAMEKDQPDSAVWLLALLGKKDEAEKQFRNIAYRRIERNSPVIQRAVRFGLLQKSKLDDFRKAMIQSNEDMKKMLDRIFRQYDG